LAARVLVVDDDRAIRRTLEKLLAGEGHEVSSASDGRQALEAAAGADLVLLDLGLPEVDGLEVLRTLHAGHESPAVIVLTARDDMQSTVRAIQLGAYDYLVKPPDIDRLKLVVRRALESRESSRTLSTLLSQVSSDAKVGNIVGRSQAMLEIYKTIGHVSTGRATVLILGESGTGKELVAKAIHYESPDRDRPFAAINISAFSRDLLESELFGHVKGAFTGAHADKAGRLELAGSGTLFLDEVGEIPLDLQAKLLRVLQERSFERVGDARPIPLKARVVAATNRDLDAMVKSGAFREDLYYRLKVVELRIPPLRERPEDIPLLIDALVGKIAKEVHRPVKYVAPRALELLCAYRWPGNVRELENMLMRAIVLAHGDVLEASLLPLSDGDAPAPAADANAILPLRVIEKRAIERALRATGWNKRRVCTLLEISRPTLDRKIEEYQLRREDE
jgi:DNA-binding NtrC family response regulator